MPMIEVLLPAGRLDGPGLSRLADGLTAILLGHQQAQPGSATARKVSWVVFDERPARSLFVGGEPSDDAVRITVTVPSGSPSLATKDAMLREMSACAAAALGGDAREPPLSIWCLLNEVPDGHWAAGGRTRAWRDVVRHVRRGDRALSRGQASSGPGDSPPARPPVGA